MSAAVLTAHVLQVFARALPDIRELTVKHLPQLRLAHWLQQLHRYGINTHCMSIDERLYRTYLLVMIAKRFANICAQYTGNIYSYADGTCSASPQSSSFVSGQCSGGSGSVVVTCSPSSWTVYMYQTSTTCSGSPSVRVTGTASECVSATINNRGTN